MEFSNNNRPVWAPWRIDFIRGEKDTKCFLCDKERTDSIDEELVVARMEHVFIILNRYPYNPGHLLISPYRHIASLQEMTGQERKQLFDAVIAGQEALTEVMQPEGFNIGFNLGKVAGAGLESHIHMHIVPRWNGDTNFMPVIGGARVVPEALCATAELLRNALN